MPQLLIVDAHIGEISCKELLSESQHVHDPNLVIVRDWRSLKHDAATFASSVGEDVDLWTEKELARHTVEYAAALGELCALAYSWQTKSHLPGEMCVREFLPVREAIRSHARRSEQRYAEWTLRPDGTLQRIS